MGIRDLHSKRRRSTLEELEGVSAVPAYDSYLTATCHRLRKKPIGEFSVEDLRIMIGQNIGLRFLVPVALDIVERNPLAHGDLYSRDLLCTLARVAPDYWYRHSDQQARLDAIIASIGDVPDDVARDLKAWLERNQTR